MRLGENTKITVLLFICAFILLGNLGGWELAGTDEPRYAQIAREMMETGQYLLPHCNGELYPHKPPVLFWLIALCSRPFGDITAFSARLPSALAGLGLILLTYLFGKKLYDPFTGLVAAFILCTSKEFFEVATSVHFDVIFAFCSTLALLFFYHGYTSSAGGKKFYILSYLSMGCAQLVKGPAGMLIPLITLVLFLAAQKDIRKIREIHLGKGIVIAVGMLLLWLVPACLAGGKAYTDNIIFTQGAGRTGGHEGPFYFYLLDFPLKAVPWILFLPSACIYFWGARKKGLNIRLPLMWFAATFVFFSLVPAKRSLYLLPLYPAFSLIMAKFLSDACALEQAEQRSKIFSTPFFLFFAILLVCGIGALIALMGSFGAVKDIMPVKSALYPVAFLAVLGGGLGIYFLRRKKSLRYLFNFLGIILVCAYFFTVETVLPAISAMRPGQELCKKMQDMIGPRELVIASFEPEYFNYFLHRYPIPVIKDDVPAVEKAMTSSKKAYYLAKETDYEDAPGELKNMVTVLDTAEIGRIKVYLLGNKAAAGSPKKTRL